ncbi:MAG: hypothetical protein JWO03_2743 [Bacteroidetes bacterium]|nr:hypothetical protein [Bacteroidota bacterium]
MRKALLLAVTFFSVLGAWSQRTCGTMHHEQLLMQIDAHYAAHRQAIDQMAQNYVMTASGQRSVVTIPVVVHVVYNANSPAGNISVAQVQSQIDRLNLDYAKLNADTASIPAVWRSLAANCQIQFCLAQRDPSGNATTGIVRKVTTSTSFIDDDKVKHASQGGDDAWPAASYLNLWACDLGNSLLGYAQFPGGPAATDGVVILNTAFGSVGTASNAPYNKGRTATHEVGHWLNLYHIWGDDGTACSGTDQVSDTPNQAGQNFGCPSFPHTDACSGSSPGVMFMNYMDYTDDACMYMFTNGQNTRIQANFATSGARHSLLSSLGCVPVSGGPATAFTANKTTICVGQSINFTDQSTGSPTSWSWSFPGAATTSSTTQNPQNIVYNTAGTYSVTLTATNAGGSTPLTKTNYITVLGTTPLPLKEGFEGSTFPPTGWSIGNGDNSTTWVRTTSASGFGTSTASAFVDNYNYNARRQKDYLYTPVYSFTQGLNANSKLKFDYAYARDQSGDYDTLQVMVSTDCGATWTSLWRKGGTTLQTTTTTYNSTFVPTSAQWKRDSTISLASYVGQSSVQFAFININDYGNSILLDNINIDTVVSSGGCTRPTASFVASATTVTAGSTVTFTDQSTNSPTAWAWTFPGGSPASSSVQVPGAVTYSTAGTYTAKLRVTNGCGSDSTTVTITVITSGGSSGCDTLSHLLAGDSARLYGTGDVNVWGYLSGSNGYGDLAKAEKYTNVNGRPVTSVMFFFVRGHAASATDSLTVNIWDANGASGLPGTVLGTTKVAMSTIQTNLSTLAFTVATFPTPVATNGTFYAGFKINYLAGDTIAVATTSYFNRANHLYQAYELNDLGGGFTQWAAVDSDWSFGMSNFIWPIQCAQSSPTAAFTANKTSLCVGDSVHFTDQSTNAPTSWSWQFNGPVNLVSSAKNPTITFTTPGTYTVILTASNAGGNGSHTQTSYITVNDLPGELMSSTTVSCFGGSDGTATVVASGGTSFTYLWSPGGGTGSTISGKPAGTYTVTVTSNFTCSSTASISITQPFSALTAATSSTSAYCSNSNGSVSVAASGGNGGFTYSWSPGGATTATVSNLAAAIYTVTVHDSKNCSATGTTTITNQTSPVVISFSNTNSTCGASNGSVVATINGSSNGAHYHWSRGDTTGSITNVAAGIYTVTITNSLGCSASKADTVLSNAGPTVTTSTTPVSCFGASTGSVIANATGGTGTLDYLWSPGGATTPSISNKPAGTYTVTVTDDNSCTATATATITQPTSAVAASATMTPVSCFGGNDGTATASGSGGTGSKTYLWSPGGATTAQLTNKTAGTYSVTVKDANLCVATATVTITQPSAAVSATATSTGVICNTAGTATVAGAGGNTGGYTYLWNPGGQTTSTINNLTAQTYSVTVKDSKQCSAVTSVAVVDQSPSLSVTITKTDATCGNSNGAVTSHTTATGITYTWSPGGSHATSLSNIPAGTYSVSISDANGCSASATINVQNSNGANVTTSSTPVTCFGSTDGTATVSASGGSGSYTYVWSGGGATTPGITGKAAGTYTVTVSDGTSCNATASVLIGGPSAALTASASSTPVICATRGTAAVTGSGGNTGGYTYLWSAGGQTTPGISNLTAATYSVTVKDSKQCSAVTSVIVSDQSLSLSVTISKTDASCGNSTGTATANTAASGVTYLWSPGGATASSLAGLGVGTYTVTITNSNGCSASATTTIVNTSGPSVTPSHTDVTCHGGNDGTATVSASGGSGSYGYTWSGGGGSGSTATQLAAGTYIVTVTSGVCSTTASVTVTEPTSVSATTSSSPVICTTLGTATATGSGGSGSGYTYLWSTSATTQTVTGLAVNTYTVTVKDGNNCPATASVSITNQTIIFSDSTSSTAASTPTTANGTATVYPVGGTANFTYTWTNGQHSQTATQLLPGTYDCTVTDSHGCTTIAEVTVGSGPSGIVDIAPSVHYSIRPNPTNDKCTIAIDMNESLPVELSIYSLIGQKVWSKELGHIRSASEVVDMSSIASGVYIVKLKAGDNIYTTRLIRE